MDYKKLKRIPKVLAGISSPPKQLYASQGNLNFLLKRPCLAIVGSRKVTPYGKEVTLQLSRQLAEQGITLISGLAFGVDSLAHQAALDADGGTIAVLPSALDTIMPASHTSLAKRIVLQAGALISEYEPGTPALIQHYIARNRLIAGLSQAVLITEAAENSGSLYTANFAKQQGKPVLAVPGNITSPSSAGTNKLLREGAIPIISYMDVLEALELEPHRAPAATIHGQNATEHALLELLLQGVTDGQELLRQSGLATESFNQTLTLLELSGKIRPLGGNRWGLY